MDVKQIIEEACNQYEKDQYAMYLRKSRTDLEMEALGEGETLARHLHMLEALAEKHGISMNQITIYKELVSGDSISERPEMQRLLADVHAKKYKGCFVIEVERLARGNTSDQGEVSDAFQISSTHIITPAKVYDPNNEFDQEYFEFGLFMSRREYKTIKRRMEAGKLQSVKEGNYILPQRVYGYDIVRLSKKERILVERPDEGKIVRMVFDWFTEEGKSTGWIAAQLTKMGIPTMRNRPEWNRGTINDILLNAHHMGKVVWGKQTVKKVYDENIGKLVKKRLPGKVQMYEGKHTGIISEEQFQKAQAIYESRKPKVKRDLEVVNPYSGLLFCSDCCGAMTYSDSGKAPSVNYNVAPRFIHPRREKCKKNQ